MVGTEKEQILKTLAKAQRHAYLAEERLLGGDPRGAIEDLMKSNQVIMGIPKAHRSCWDRFHHFLVRAMSFSQGR